MSLMPNSESESRQLSKVLGLTPPYLDPCCHEAVYEIDLGAIATSHLPSGFFMNWSGQQQGEGFGYHLLMTGCVRHC